MLLLLTVPPTAAAQPANQPCAVEAAPEDEFQSQGLGLTTEELETLYGEREIGQGSIFFDYNGFDLHKDGCDVILAFPLDGIADGQGTDEFVLAESLLPADAEYAGSFARGSTIRSQQAATLWRSASLAERFAEMGEYRGGEILILYTYEQVGLEPGPIQRVELRTLELPE
jgi:hypothetical protein